MRFQRALWMGAGVALAVLAATVAWSCWNLRRQVGAEIVGRDGEILTAVAAMQYAEDKTNGQATASLEDPGEQIELAFEVAKLRNVIAVRLFSPEGQFVSAAPGYIKESVLPPDDMEILRALKPVSHFRPDANLADESLIATETNLVPLLDVNVPLVSDDGQRLVGAMQFVMDGHALEPKFAALDRRLAWQFALEFAVGGSLLALGLAVAFHRVQRANRLLLARTTDLVRANRELALAAKTSAVGAVTSFLIHGLRNPLSGLRNFVRERASGSAAERDSEWQMAVASTRRMEDLIDRVVRVLQEQESVDGCEISLDDLAVIVSNRLSSAARAAGVRFETAVTGSGSLSSRETELVLLILENLVQNAIEATPSGKTVRLVVFNEGRNVAVEVRDEGPGMPPDLQERVFSPCTSSKKGGSGIGLAISRELAKHVGADLRLARSSVQGCVFRMVLPLAETAEPGLETEVESANRGV